MLQFSDGLEFFWLAKRAALMANRLDAHAAGVLAGVLRTGGGGGSSAW
jgi:hypothetical protein